MADCKIQSGDILLCSGNGKFSKRIQKFQRIIGAPKESAMLSHVAGVWGLPYDYIPEESMWARVLESTTLNKWANKRGVQVNLFSDWFENYNGHIWLRHLDFGRTKEYYKKDRTFWMDHKDDDYENGIPGVVELFLCGLQLNTVIQKLFPKWKPKPTKEVHCAELIAQRLWYHGLFTPKLHEEQAFSRLPPWFWWSEIDKYLNVPISKPIQLK